MGLKFDNPERLTDKIDIAMPFQQFDELVDIDAADNKIEILRRRLAQKLIPDRSADKINFAVLPGNRIEEGRGDAPL